ncbi:MAG: hypothetical protein KDC48_13505, partial [Planctomycetes bacterium]|nr:hypothetical protein [Planctomycetota bacterium]
MGGGIRRRLVRLTGGLLGWLLGGLLGGLLATGWCDGSRLVPTTSGDAEGRGENEGQGETGLHGSFWSDGSRRIRTWRTPAGQTDFNWPWPRQRFEWPHDVDRARQHL